MMLFLALLVGCGELKLAEAVDAMFEEFNDEDGDGVEGPEPDCDDSNPDVHPGATEVCNSIDDDCDGTVDINPIDDDSSTRYYVDADGDGQGGPDFDYFCTPPETTGYVTEGGDCDDADPEINPAAVEIPDNGIDEDCDCEIVDIDCTS